LFVYNIIIIIPLFSRLRGSGLRVYRKSNIILMSWVAPAVAVKSAKAGRGPAGGIIQHIILLLLLLLLRVLLLRYILYYDYYYFYARRRKRRGGAS